MNINLVIFTDVFTLFKACLSITYMMYRCNSTKSETQFKNNLVSCTIGDDNNIH